MLELLPHAPGQREDERGATSIEYAIMVGLIAVVIVVAVATLGIAVFDLFDSVPSPFAS